MWERTRRCFYISLYLIILQAAFSMPIVNILPNFFLNQVPKSPTNEPCCKIDSFLLLREAFGGELCGILCTDNGSARFKEYSVVNVRTAFWNDKKNVNVEYSQSPYLYSLFCSLLACAREHIRMYVFFCSLD